MAKSKGKKKLRRGSDDWRSLPASVMDSVGFKSHTYRSAIQRGQYFSMLIIAAGVGLALLGISGNLDLVVEAKNFTGRLQNASPGIILAALGVVVLMYYKPRNSQETTFDRRRESAPSVEVVGGSWHSVSSSRHRGVGTVSERITHRHEERGYERAPENRSMEGRIQHGDVRYQKKDS